MYAWYRLLFPVMWLSWCAYWWISSFNIKQAVRTESLLSRWAHVAPLMLAAILVSFRHLPIGPLNERFIPRSAEGFWAGALLCAAGLLFSVWARRTLGTNWSGTITIKQDHQLITSGPYRWVRHPIYSGLLLAFIGTALAIGEWRAILALALVAIAIWRKVWLEETWMKQEFGGAHDEYAARVKALIPGIL